MKTDRRKDAPDFDFSRSGGSAGIVEQWRSIAAWPGYEVSDSGRVRRAGRLLKLFTRKGYPSFNATCGPRRRALKVHVEVAIAFIGPQNGRLVRHRDGDQRNSRLTNLAYGTPKENADDRAAHGTTAKGSRIGTSKLTEEDVLALRRLPGRPPKVLLEQLGIHSTTARRIQRRILWKHLV
jgi:hypothetical protein